MVIDTQKAQKIDWIQTDEMTVETCFHGYWASVRSLGEEQHLITIAKDRDGAVLYQEWVQNSQRQAESQAETQLKNLIPKTANSEFNPPER